MEKTDQLDDEDLQKLDSVLEIASTSSTVSSTLGTDDVPAGDLSTSGGSFGDVPSVLVAEPVIPRLDELPAAMETVTAAVVREKCVGRNKAVAWGFTSLIGRRKEMEDAVAVAPTFMSTTCENVGGCTAPGSRSSSEISPLHFFGVYDGHGGSQVARFCAERMHEVVGEEWNRATVVDGIDWHEKWKAVFSSSFERADSEVVMAGGEATEMIGSTAIVAVISACQIIVSNCGDSRAILCRGTQSIPLSVDQKPDREDELTRIEAAGGKVINWNGARVFGVLAMSRSIGDRYLRPWIISVPEVSFTRRMDDDECVILASDGLWDVMSNDEVAEVARRVLRRRRRANTTTTTTDDATMSAAQYVADALTEIAIGRNSSDNISIIAIDLKSKRKRIQKNPIS
ncbi:probable protein phosphatase 2C 6 [Impatiens glandulifera]|uniref:probable protein phosphatase 2C 6 n=1 Tax=Impatiens glandulifera TaxID=253017 RepID=UPI001FB0DF26|nr:probable protein phosphatase 2C 6 [Impatiens glandulifera]